MSAKLEGLTKIALTQLVREVEMALEAEARPFQAGGQHHNGPRRISIDFPVNRAAALLAVWKEQLDTPIEDCLGGDAIAAIADAQRRETEQLRALHELMADDIVFCHRDEPFFTHDDNRTSVHYSILISDTFAMACADAEELAPSEAVILSQLIRDRPSGVSPSHIATCWVAMKRGLTAKDIVYKEAQPPKEAWDYFEKAFSRG